MKVRWVGYVASEGESRSELTGFFYGKPKGKELFWRLKRWRKYNIKTDIKSYELDSVFCCYGPLACVCEHCDKPCGTFFFLAFGVTVVF